MATIRDNTAESQWELLVDGDIAAVSTYHDHGNRRTFLHTETMDGFEGKGLASELVRAALEDARDRGLEINAVCPFVRGWLDRHPDFGVSSGATGPGGGDAGDKG
jgi:predicted GNAT family acetyltransferase